MVANLEIGNIFYVYAFYCEEWEDYFYVGKGSGDRINHTSGRNPHVYNVLTTKTVRRVKLRENLSEEDAYRLEKEIKKSLREQGSPLLNYEAKKSVATSMRQREGIEAAKKQGKFKGRKPIKVNEEQWRKLHAEMYKGNISKQEMADELNMSIGTLYRKLKEYEENKLGNIDIRSCYYEYARGEKTLEEISKEEALSKMRIKETWEEFEKTLRPEHEEGERLPEIPNSVLVQMVFGSEDKRMAGIEAMKGKGLTDAEIQFRIERGKRSGITW